MNFELGQVQSLIKMDIRLDPLGERPEEQQEGDVLQETNLDGMTLRIRLAPINWIINRSSSVLDFASKHLWVVALVSLLLLFSKR